MRMDTATQLVRPRPATGCISSDPAIRACEQVVRGAYHRQYGWPADSNQELDLLRLVAMCVRHHREATERGDARAAGFLALANNFQRGL